MITALRALAVAVLIVLTVTLQVSIFANLSVNGVVPDLVMLVVIAAALVRGPDYAALVGFAAGLVLDLAPPADSTAGRWALTFVVVGYLTGLARRVGDDISLVGTLFMVAAGAFIGTSVYALSGLVLGDQGVAVNTAFRVVPVSVLYDVLITPLVVPLVVLLFRRLEPADRW